MKPALMFLAGAGAGFLVASVLIRPGNSDARVASGVRDRVGSELGSGAQAVGDVLGLWKYTPGLLNFFGVPT